MSGWILYYFEGKVTAFPDVLDMSGEERKQRWEQGCSDFSNWKDGVVINWFMKHGSSVFEGRVREDYTVQSERVVLTGSYQDKPKAGASVCSNSVCG